MRTRTQQLCTSTEACQYCSRTYSRNGITQHEKRCSRNPDLQQSQVRSVGYSNWWSFDFNHVFGCLVLLFLINQIVTCFYWDLLGPVLDRGHSFIVDSTATKWTQRQLQTEAEMRGPAPAQ
jgi:hypothetical protein